MGIFDRLRHWLSPAPPPPPAAAPPPVPEKRYDNVEIVNLADGARIQGHEAVKAYYEKEEELLREHGSCIIFQIYRIDLEAETYAELYGKKLAEIKADPAMVTASDTVAAVKSKLRQLIPVATPGLEVGDDDQMTLFFNDRRMREDKLFYADHYMLLPVWVQVYLHACDPQELSAIASRLSAAPQS